MQSHKTFGSYGRVCLMLLLALSLTPILARAQNSITGELKGTVTDNGTQGYNINFLSDGIRATAPRDFNSSNYYLPVDAISEVSINSGNAPAQYGNGLTSINVITKSGTNSFHGSAFEYVQNTAFNARGFYNQTGTKAVEHWNEYGGSVGGPIVKNKLFFFFAYQRNPSSTPVSGLWSYPTAAMEAGDFYGIQGATGKAFSATGQLLGTYRPRRRSCRPTSRHPRAGMDFGMPRPGRRGTRHSPNLPDHQ
jgi:hypothetical protein